MNNYMTLRDYVSVLFRQKMIIFTCLIVVAVTAYVQLSFKTPTYKSTVKMLLTASKSSQAQYYETMRQLNAEAIQTQSEIVRSAPVIERVVEATQLYRRPLDFEANFASPLKKRLIRWQAKKQAERMANYDEKQQEFLRKIAAKKDLLNRVSVQPLRDSNIFEISVTDFTPFAAAGTANIVSRSYIMFDLEQQLAETKLKYTENHTAVTQLEDHIKKMSETLDGRPLATVDAIGPASVKIIEQASVDLNKIGPSKKLLFIAVILMGLIIGCVLAFFFDSMNQNVRSPKDVEKSLEVPVFGTIHKKKGFFEWEIIRRNVHTRKLSPRSKSIKELAEHLRLLARSGRKKTFLFAPVQNEKQLDKILVNLSLILSRDYGEKVLLIESDLRNATLHKYFRTKKSHGWHTYSQKLQKLETVDHAQNGHTATITIPSTNGNGIGTVLKEINKNLHFLPAGGRLKDFDGAYHFEVVKKIVDTVRNNYSIILMNSPDLLREKDAALLLAMADGVIASLNDDSIRRKVAENAINPLKSDPSKFLGVVLNDYKYALPGFVYKRV